MKQIEKKIEQMLESAIRTEEDSYKIYQKGLRIVQSESVRELLEELAAEERQHKAKLKEMLRPEKRAEMIAQVSQEKAINFQIGDYLTPREVHPNATLQDILTVAMQREKDSFQYYTAMAGITTGEVKALFGVLASEEIKHKQRIESIYDDIIYKEF
jgi:rubrerythrin